MAKFTPDTKEELKALVEDESIYLGDIDTSKITDMSCLFRNSTREDFSGIEKWDVSSVRDMSYMFSYCKNFNQPLNGWDVSGVENMCAMFKYCTSFNQDISKWDVSNVKDMDSMFWGCHSFNQDISGWDVLNVENMSYMFSGCENFNQDLSSWDTSKVKTMAYMFADCENFNQDISGWDVGKVRNMEYMFKDCTSFNQPLGGWDVSGVENMRGIFLCCESFNQDLSSWDISNVEYTYNMFENCPIDNSNKPKNLRWQGRDKIFKKRDVLIENNNKSVKSFGHLLREVYEQHFYFILTIIFILGFFININSLDILKIRQYDFAFIAIPMFISVAIEFRFIIEKLNRGLFLLGFLSCIIDAISQGNEIFRLIGISLLTINIIKIIMTNKHKIFP
ncbi:BspA family leucine-rich repeat surface protein [Campylobacter jejuni]|nr:BspA family leucine-rich repeat surface protein [Campylobacter jejuni]EEP3556885.1 BspA family leucine-rich repeat surface protein [Campylobacter jejuni]